MKRTVPLFEFMPYGAPELLESRQRFMSRALAMTSALALVLYALASGIAPLLAVAPDERPPIVVQPDVFEVLPERSPDVAPAPPKPAPPVVHEAAKPIPVKDDIAPPSDVPAPPTTTSNEKATGETVSPAVNGDTGPAVETLPVLGTWVYVEREPAPIKEVKPDYPRMAWEAQVEGRVTVHVLIGKDGSVLDAVLAKEIQVPMLNAAALEAARKWRFTPGIANGHPVACWTAIPFNFRLH